MEICVIAFKNNISERIAKLLQIKNKYYLNPNESEIRNFQVSNNVFVLGLGQYSGKDKDKLRIETICKNKFRNKLIDINGKSEYLISTQINPGVESKNACGIGNSYCNLLSYLIASKNNNYAFIHIPKNFDIETAGREIKILCQRFLP